LGVEEKPFFFSTSYGEAAKLAVFFSFRFCLTFGFPTDSPLLRAPVQGLVSLDAWKCADVSSLQAVALLA
jgi:hypothetical protein